MLPSASYLRTLEPAYSRTTPVSSVLASAQPPSGRANTNTAPSRLIRAASRSGDSTCSQCGAPTTIVAPSSDTDNPLPKFTAPSPEPPLPGALVGPGLSVASGELSSAQPPAGLSNT